MFQLKTKKAIYFRPVVVLILALIFLVSIILIIFTIKKTMSEKVEETECIASIEAHISFIEAKYLAKDQVGETVGIGSLFLPEFDQEVPEIKCLPKLIKSKAKNSEEVEKEILKSALETWNLFKQGKGLVYEEISNKNLCVIMNVIEFDKSIDIDLIDKSYNTRVNELIGGLDSDSVAKYLPFILSQIKDPNEVQMSCDSLLDYLYEDLQIIEDVKNSDYTEAYSSFLEHRKILATIIAYNMTSTCSESKINKIQSFSMNLGHSAFVSNTNVPIAIIFAQSHITTINGKWVKFVGSGFRLLQHKKVPDFYDYYSSIQIIPYTQKNLKLIGCEELPVAFE